MVSTKALNTALSLLKDYQGDNPYLHMLKKDVFVKNIPTAMNDFAVEYINLNHNRELKPINRVTKIADWFAETCKEKWGTDFLPNRLRVLSLLGETKETYHCYVQYRKSLEPVMLFIPKKAVLKNFLVEDYTKISVDFDRYDRLSANRAPNNPRKLMEHQKEAVKFLFSRKKCVLADDMGLGKTTEVIVAAIEGNFDAVLVICPAGLKSNWLKELGYYIPEREITIIGGCDEMKKDEIEKYLGYGIGRSGKNLQELRLEAKERGKWNDNRFVVINYDILDDVYSIPGSRSKENIELAYENSPMLQYVKGKKALIIVDEAHKLSNLKAGRYKIVNDMIKRSNPDSIYLITGTPITNDPENYFNLLYLLGDTITDNWQYYMERYCDAIKIPKDDAEKAKRDRITREYLSKKGKSTWQDLNSEEKKILSEMVARQCKMRTIPKGVSNLEELKDRTSHLYLRRTKEDLLGGLPNKVYHERFFSLTQEQQREYDRLWNEYLTAKAEEGVNPNVSKELIEGGLYKKYLSDQMVPHTIKLTEKCLERGEKVLIACCYDDELYTLRDHFGDKCVIYNGKMSAKDKDKAVYEFMNNPGVLVFIGNIDSCGVGITLTSARVVIFNNMSWVPGINKQLEDRVYRIGQKREVHIFYQYFKQTYHDRIRETVNNKQTNINMVIKKEDEK